MLDGYFHAGCREVEHVEDNRLVAAVLATMDRAHYFDQRLAFMGRTFVTVLADDS